MKILVLGATGETGRHIVEGAVADGHQVVALVRSAERAADLSGATLIEGDARDERAVAGALEGCSAVACALGAPIRLFGEVTLLSEATRVLLAAMRRSHVRRLVCITGIGAGDSRGHGGFLYDRILQPVLLRAVYHDKDRQEHEIAASGLDWVIVRPVMLTNGSPSVVQASADAAVPHGNSIARASVARFVLDQLTDDRWLHRSPIIWS